MRVTQLHPNMTKDEVPSVAPRGAPFSIEVTSGKRAVTVRVAGELDAANAPELGNVLLTSGHGGRQVLLDLDETSFIDSAGIRILVRSMWDLQATGSQLRLVEVSPMAENILRITGILDVLKDQTP